MCRDEEERQRGGKDEDYTVLGCPRTDALLPSYVRTTGPEFDLIFSRKEIKRKWPTRESDDERARSLGNPLKYSKLLP